MREFEVRDDADGRNVARVLYDRDREHVYIETTGNHDGVVVCTKVRIERLRFATLLKAMGVL